MSEKKLTAHNLKQELWEVLQEIRQNKIDPQQAEAVASQSREIIRVLRAQQSVLKQAAKKVTEEMIEFVTKIEN